MGAFLVLGCPTSKSSSTTGNDEPTTTAAAPTSPAEAPALAPLGRAALPGMFIDLPDPAAVRGDYRTGSAQHDSGPIEWAVTWQPGTVPPAVPLRRIVANMAEAMGQKLGSSSTSIRGSREVALAGGAGRQYEIANDQGYAAFVTFAGCGGRVIQIIAGGTAPALRATNDRIVASFECAADAGAPPGPGAVVLDARPGWRPASANSEMLANDRHVLVRPASIPDTSGLPIADLVTTAARGSGFQLDARPPSARGDRMIWTATLPRDGGTRPAAIVAWRCAARPLIAIVYVMSAAGAPLEEGLDLALTARCRGPE